MNNERLIIVDHPLVQHKLSILRDKNTPTKEFREIIGELAMLECYEVSRNLQLQDVEIETPLQKMTAKKLVDNHILIVPILRAGLGLVNGLQSLIPTADVGHLGMQRDPQTHKPIAYYEKMPNDLADRSIMVVDPMLATGGSLCMAIEYLRKKGYKKEIMCMVVVSAPEGIKAVMDFDPNTFVVTCAIDDCLNENAYILPGLGDAGDRIFGTD